jgi:hypothetical protein
MPKLPKTYSAKPHSELGMRIFKSEDGESTYLVLRSGANPNASGYRVPLTPRSERLGAAPSLRFQP